MNNLKTYENKYTQGYGIQFPEGHIIRTYKHFISNLLPEQNASYKFLNFGCGNGIHSKYFSSQGFDVYGADISQTAIQQAKINNQGYKSNFYTIKNNDLLQYIGNNKFDLILANQSLYYSDDQELKDIMKQFDMLLNKGGLVIFTMMSINNYYSQYIEENLPNGLSKVVLNGRLNETTYINFVNNFTDLEKRFSSFTPLYSGIYDMTMREGSSEHMFFVGRKRN